MAKKRRRKAPADPMFHKRERGTEITIRIEAGLLRTLDDYRDQVDKITGVQLTRRDVLEGLLRKVWWKQIEEATVLGVGDKLGSKSEKHGGWNAEYAASMESIKKKHGI